MAADGLPADPEARRGVGPEHVGVGGVRPPALPRRGAQRVAAPPRQGREPPERDRGRVHLGDQPLPGHRAPQRARRRVRRAPLRRAVHERRHVPQPHGFLHRSRLPAHGRLGLPRDVGQRRLAGCASDHSGRLGAVVPAAGLGVRLRLVARAVGAARARPGVHRHGVPDVRHAERPRPRDARDVRQRHPRRRGRPGDRGLPARHRHPRGRLHVQRADGLRHVHLPGRHHQQQRGSLRRRAGLRLAVLRVPDALAARAARQRAAGRGARDRGARRRRVQRARADRELRQSQDPAGRVVDQLPVAAGRREPRLPLRGHGHHVAEEPDRRPAQQAVLGPELSVLRSEPSARGRHDHVQPHVAVRLRVRPDPVPGSGPAGRLRRDRGQYGGRAERA